MQAADFATPSSGMHECPWSTDADKATSEESNRIDLFPLWRASGHSRQNMPKRQWWRTAAHMARPLADGPYAGGIPLLSLSCLGKIPQHVVQNSAILDILNLNFCVDPAPELDSLL